MPLGAVGIVALATGLAVLLYPDEAAEPWITGVNPLTHDRYTDRAEWDKVRHLSPEQFEAELVRRRVILPGAPVGGPMQSPVAPPPARAPSSPVTSPVQEPSAPPSATLPGSPTPDGPLRVSGDYVGELPGAPNSRGPGQLTITASNPSPSERATAEWLRDLGFNFLLRDPAGSRGGLGTSDGIVNDQIWDIYTPERDTRIDKIAQNMRDKVTQVGRGGNVIVNLRNSRHTLEDIRRFIHNQRRNRENPFRGLRRYLFMRR